MLSTYITDRKKEEKKDKKVLVSSVFLKSTFYTHKIVGFEIDPEAIYTPLTFLTYITLFSYEYIT